MQKNGTLSLNHLWQNTLFREAHSKRSSERLKILHIEGKIKVFSFKGKTHKEESKSKIGLKNSMHMTGEGNSQYGKVWIMNEEMNKLIKKEELDIWLKQGWEKGRKIKAGVV